MLPPTGKNGARAVDPRQLSPTKRRLLPTRRPIRIVLANDFGEGSQLGLQNGLPAFNAVEFDQQGVAFGACCPPDVLAQAREVTLDRLQFGLDGSAIDLIWSHGFVGENGAEF